MEKGPGSTGNRTKRQFFRDGRDFPEGGPGDNHDPEGAESKPVHRQSLRVSDRNPSRCQIERKFFQRTRLRWGCSARPAKAIQGHGTDKESMILGTVGVLG